MFLSWREGANPNPKLVSSLGGRERVTTSPNLKPVWGLGRQLPLPNLKLVWEGRGLLQPQTQPSPPTGVGGSMTTAGPYNAIPSALLGVGSVCGFGPALVGIHSISLAARYRVAVCSTTLAKDLRKSIWLVDAIALLFSLSVPSGKKNFPLWPSAQRMQLILFVGWTVMTHLMMFRKTKRRLPLNCFWTNFTNKTLLGLYLVVPLESPGTDQSLSCC